MSAQILITIEAYEMFLLVIIAIFFVGDFKDEIPNNKPRIARGAPM